MFVFKTNINKPKTETFGNLRVGQSFTRDNMVYLKVKPFVTNGITRNAVRISAEKKPGTDRFRYFDSTGVVYNSNKYHLVHESRLVEVDLM